MKKIGMMLLVFIGMISCKNEIKNTTETSSLIIDSTQVRKHLYTLASDEMEGRRAGTVGIERAAQYIETEFKRLGLSTYDTLSSTDKPSHLKIDELKKTLPPVILLECWKEKVKKRKL